MRLVLAHPPLDDPTLPYHSTSYLAGHLVHNGFTDVAIRDINIEFVNWTFEAEVLSAFYDEAARRLSAFELQGTLTFVEQEEYLGLWRPKPVPFDELQRAISGMRDRESFLDFARYKQFRATILQYQEMLSALSYPCELSNFRLSNRGRFSPYNLRDLFDASLTTRICQVFDRFLDERLSADAEFCAADCIGLSIVYDHQMFHSLHFARWAKRRWPDKQVLLGGTAISQFYKYMRDKQMMKNFFSVCDGIVVGEGETALCQIADAGGRVVSGMKVHNLLSYDRAADRLFLPDHIHYENVSTLGRPLYRYPWELYLAPERGINYSPTRGCYWNRCTFCDYGLNTSKPTSPWRERSIDQAIVDLRSAVQESGTRFVYFAVDVMSPAYLERLSDAIIDAGLDIRWAAELRMEKVFSRERCAKLVESGCVCVSFGMESGNQRILDLIDKGTKVAFMGETMKNFAEVGVAVQLMAFSDFPSETPAEKEETRHFVREHQEHWSVGGMGTFLLTGTAIVAKDPARFGVRLVETEDVDVLRALAYEADQDSRDEESKSMLTEDRDASFDSTGRIFPSVLGRPWAGGTDTLHSMIYYDFHGRRFFRDQAGEREPVPEGQMHSCLLSLPGVLRASPFDLGKIIAERRRMSAHLGQLSKIPREPTQRTFRDWADSRPALAADARRRYWIMSGAKCVRLDPFVYELLSRHSQPTVLAKLLDGLDEALRARLMDYFQRLAGHGLVELNLPSMVANAPIPTGAAAPFSAKRSGSSGFAGGQPSLL
jgi:anaerobic magnesium-protoporphyrin IX monomethyl ester cyclase